MLNDLWMVTMVQVNPALVAVHVFQLCLRVQIWKPLQDSKQGIFVGLVMPECTISIQAYVFPQELVQA